MNRVYRSLKRELDQTALVIKDVRHNKHYVFTCETPSGRRCIVAAAVTSSDYRSLKNFRSTIRKLELL